MPDTNDPSALPESIMALLHEGEDQGPSTLNLAQRTSLSKMLCDTRTKHQNYRKQSGAEDRWIRYAEAYLGIDNGNRHEYGATRLLVPSTMGGPLREERPSTTTGCTLYVRLTSRYVDAASAKSQETLIPTDEKSFSYEPTPVPSLITKQHSKAPVMLSDGTPAERDATPSEQASMPAPLPQPVDPSMPQQAPMPPGMPLLESDLAAEEMELARKAAKLAEKRVDDWKAEANYAAHMRRVLADSPRLGVGVLKGPFPCIRKSMAVTKGPRRDSNGNPVMDQSGKPVEQTTISFEEKISPDWAAVSPWDIYPAPSCGENVRNSDWFFHRDRLSRSQVEALGELPGYIQSAIVQVLDEGPEKRSVRDDDRPQKSTEDDHRYQVWYAYGSLTRDEWNAVQEAGYYPEGDGPSTLPEGKRSVFAIVTLINDCVVYASLNHLQSGTIPFYTFSWQPREDSWAGVGVGEQVDTAQRGLNAAFRAMLDNAGLSAGAQIIRDRDAVYAENGDDSFTRNKVWIKTAECDDVRKAFAVFQIPNITNEMMQIIELNYKIAEDSCNIPLISQGQSGSTTPDTFGAVNLQNNNANQLLRGIAARYDDAVTEPESRATYEWLLLDPTVPEEEKGDFQIYARGSAALVERAIQDQAAVEVLKLVATNGEVLGADPKKAFAEYLKSKRFDPTKYQFTKEELEQKSKQPPPKDPVVQVAEIRAQVDMQKVKVDTDRDTAFVQAQTEQNKIENDAKMQELALKLQLEQLKYANMMKISMNEVKAELAQTGMKLTVQKELSAMSLGLEHAHATPQTMTPPTEPVGRAPVGESFQE